jgi:hypothetical protein
MSNSSSNEELNEDVEYSDAACGARLEHWNKMAVSELILQDVMSQLLRDSYAPQCTDPALMKRQVELLQRMAACRAYGRRSLRTALQMGFMKLASELWSAGAGKLDQGLRNTVYSRDALLWGLARNIPFDLDGLVTVMGMDERDGPALLALFLQGVPLAFDPDIWRRACSTRGMALVGLHALDQRGEQVPHQLVDLAERTCEVPALSWLKAKGLQFDAGAALAHARCYADVAAVASLQNLLLDDLFVDVFKKSAITCDAELRDIMLGFCDTNTERTRLFSAAVKANLYDFLVDLEAFDTARALASFLAKGRPRLVVDQHRLWSAELAASQRRLSDYTDEQQQRRDEDFLGSLLVDEADQ